MGGERGESANKLALRSAVLLGGNSLDRMTTIFRHMKRAYRVRSDLAHGSEVSDLKFADGTPATVGGYVSVLAEYVRDGLKLLIEDAARSPETLPFGRWDDVVLKRLAGEPDEEDGPPNGAG